VEQLSNRTETLVKDLIELAREFQSAPAVVDTVKVIDVGAASSLIREAERLFAVREKLLESAVNTPAKARAVIAEVASHRAEVVQQAEAIKRLEEEISLVGVQLDARKEEAVVAKKRGAEARGAVEHIQRLRAYIEEHPRILLSLEELHRSSTRLNKDLSEASAVADGLTVAVERASEAQRELREASERTKSYRLLHSRVSLWSKDVASVQVMREELAECRLRQSSSVLRMADARRRVDITLKAEKAAKGRLANAQRQRDEIAQLASSIMVKLTADHCKCPVCHSLFEPGELLRRATEEAAAVDPLLGEAQEECSAAAKAVVEANLDVTQIQEADLYLSSRMAELNSIVSAHDAELESLRATEAIAGLSTENAEALLNQLANLWKASELTMEQWSRAGNDVMALREELTQAEKRREGIEAELLRLRHTADEGRSRLQTVEGELTANRIRVEPWGKDASQADADVAESIQRMTQAEGSEEENQQQLRGLNHELDALKDRRGAAVRHGEAHQQLLEEREHYLKVLQDDWTATGLPDGIDESNVERMRQKLSRAREKLAGLKTHEHRLREESVQVQTSAEYEQDEARIRTILAKAMVASEAERTAVLEIQLKRLEEEKALTLRAYALYRKLADRLKEEAKQYAQNVIMPLQARANGFHLALSPFPERELILGVRAALGAGTSLHLNVQPHRGRKSSEELAAHLLLSEGQLSEASLSFLFGMSTIYRWSRWRALLLDDPLQQNDVIHLSSFVDVIRRLVIDSAYQVIVSTHDSDLADFMVRKARSGGVRCAVYRFVNPGRANVTYRAT